MKPNHEKVLKEALRLPTEARAALAGRLLESLDETVDEDVELAWSKDVARCIDELDRGKVKTVPWSVARRQILGRFGAFSLLGNLPDHRIRHSGCHGGPRAACWKR